MIFWDRGTPPGSRGPQDFICKLQVREMDVFSSHKNEVGLEMLLSWQNARVIMQNKASINPAP